MYELVLCEKAKLIRQVGFIKEEKAFKSAAKGRT